MFQDVRLCGRGVYLRVEDSYNVKILNINYFKWADYCKNMDIINYIAKVWPYKVDEVYLDEKTLFNEKNIDNLIAELFSDNLNGEKDIAGKAAMTMQKLRQIPESKLDIMERDAGKEMIKEVFYDMFNENYSKNVSLNNYLECFHETSLMEIIFRQEKESGSPFEFENYWSERNYRLVRCKNQVLFEIRTPKEFWEPFAVNNRLGIKFEAGNLPDYKPSDKINNYLNKTSEVFPYPLRGETGWSYNHDKKIGSAITRYLPNLEWYDLNLREGEFRGEHWSAILSGLRDSELVDRNLDDFDKNKYILRKLYTFSAPVGEFELKFHRNREREDPSIIFSYSDKYTKPELKIDRAKIYRYGDINPNLF